MGSIKRLTAEEIINETVQFYSEDVSRRSIGENGTCVYNGLNDNHCAFGRCMKPEYKAQGDKLLGNYEVSVETLMDLHGFDSLENFLEPQYHGQDLSFWRLLQDLHDIDSHWEEDGISGLGEMKVEELHNLFAEEDNY